MLKRFSSFQQAARHLLRLDPKGQARVISFDVFDTLVHRRMDPDVVLHGVARELEVLLRRHGEEPVADAMSCRHAAYAEVSAGKVAQGLDHDMTLEELAEAWVRHTAGREFPSAGAVAKEVVELEVRYELWACFANPTLRAACKELKERGFRLIYVSDMYLGRRHVKQILDTCGYGALFDEGYVSGDHSLLKRTGRLYDLVLEKENLEPHQMIHIGDNPLGDGRMSRSRKIPALLVQDKEFLNRYKWLKNDHKRLLAQPNWAGMVAAQFAQHPPGTIASPQEAMGHRNFGPIFAAFIHKVLERSLQEGTGAVYFMAREGFLLKDLYNELVSTLGIQAPPGVYLGISRLSTFMAAMHGFSLREITMASANINHYSLRNLLAPFRMGEERLSRIAARHGIADINEPLPPFFMDWPPLHRVLEDAEGREYVSRISTEARRLLIDYLKDLGFFEHKRVSVVDVGWSGQIQDNLFAALEGQPRPRIYGMYMGLNERAHWRKTPESWMEWVLCDIAHPDWFGTAALEYVQGIEAVSRAPHGTVLGYRRLEDNGRGKMTVPVFRPERESSRQAEIIDEPLIALLQKGIRDYTREYSRCVRIIGAGATETLTYARSATARLLRFPTPQEASWLLQFSNVSDLGSSTTLSMGGDFMPLSRLHMMRHLRSFIRGSFWKAGSMALLGNGFLLMLWHIRHAIKSLPKREVALVSGIVWNTPHPSSPASTDGNGTGPALPPSWTEEAYEADICKKEEARYEAGHRQAHLIRSHHATHPLTLREGVWLLATFRCVKLVCRLGKRHMVYNDAIALQGLLYRHLPAFPRGRRLLRAIRRIARMR